MRKIFKRFYMVVYGDGDVALPIGYFAERKDAERTATLRSEQFGSHIRVLEVTEVIVRELNKPVKEQT